jgi:hypothetical protein
LNFKDIRCTILDNDGQNELSKTLGEVVMNRIKEEFKKLGVSVVDRAKIVDLIGDHALRKIHFKKVISELI